MAYQLQRDKKVKVLYLALVEMAVYGGPRTHLLEICQNLAKLGHEVLILLPTQKMRHSVAGCRVISIPFFGFSLLGLVIYYLVTSLYLIYYLFKFKPDCVYERDMNSQLTVTICHLLKKPIIIEVNGSAKDDLEQLNAKRFAIYIACLIQKYELKLADRVIVTGRGLKKRLQEEYRLSPDKIFVVDNGVNSELFYPMDKNKCRIRIGLSPERFYLGFIGTFHPHHDIITLISSLPIVSRVRPDICLVMVGKGQMLSEAKRKVDELGLNKNVIFIGSVPYDEMAYYINSFDISILTVNSVKINREGISSFKLLEYMACGQAVIVNDLPDSPTSHDLRDKVISVPPGNPDALGDAIVSLMKDKELKKKLGKEAHDFIVERNLTWKDAAGKTQRLLLHKKAGT